MYGRLQKLNAITMRETHHILSPFNQISVVPVHTRKTMLDMWNGYYSPPHMMRTSYLLRTLSSQMQCLTYEYSRTSLQQTPTHVLQSQESGGGTCGVGLAVLSCMRNCPRGYTDNRARRVVCLCHMDVSKFKFIWSHFKHYADRTILKIGPTIFDRRRKH